MTILINLIRSNLITLWKFYLRFVSTLLRYYFIFVMGLLYIYYISSLRNKVSTLGIGS